MLFETDWTSADYNAYCEIADIDALMDQLEVLNGSIGWGILDSGVKEVHIVNASKRLSSVEFSGALNPLVITNNPMKFPRSGLTYQNGTPVPEDIIPNEVCGFVACFIYDWIASGRTTTQSSNVGAIKSKKVGDVSITYETGGSIIQPSEDGGADCIDNNIPSGWYEDELSSTIGGIGTVGTKRGL